MSDYGSPQSTRSSGSRRRKKKVRRGVVDLEQVFASMSSVRAHGGPRSPARIMLSPRSAEACLREGVDPEELKVRGVALCVSVCVCVCGACCCLCACLARVVAVVV